MISRAHGQRIGCHRLVQAAVWCVGLLLGGAAVSVRGQVNTVPAGSPVDAPTLAVLGYASLAPEPVTLDVVGAGELGNVFQEVVRCVADEQPNAALQHTAAYLRENPRSAAAHELHGALLLLTEQWESALAHLQRSVQLNPRQSTACTKIGELLLLRGDGVGARSYLQQAVTLNPADRFAHQRLGVLFERDAEFERAAAHFEQGLRAARPGYLGVQVNLGRLWNLSGRAARTAQLLAPLADESCEVVPAHLVLGTAWLILGENEKAMASFAHARNHEPRPENTQLALGMAYREAGQPERSRQQLQTALLARPGWVLAELQLAETFRALGRGREAAEFLGELATREPTARSLARACLVELYSRDGDLDPALAAFSLLRQDGAAPLRTYGVLAAALDSAHRPAEAEESLLEAERRYSPHPQVQQRLGLHYSLVGDYDRALQRLRQAQALVPADPQIAEAIRFVEGLSWAQRPAK